MSGPVLSRRLVLESRVDMPDGAGGYQRVWAAAGTLWADMRARTGREGVTAGRDASRLRYRVIVRGAPVGAASRPRPDQRFREGVRVYPILAVAEADAAGLFLICDVEEGALT